MARRMTPEEQRRLRTIAARQRLEGEGATEDNQETPEKSETTEGRTEQRGGVDVSDIMKEVSRQADSGELASKARKTPVTYTVTVPRDEHPDLADDKAGDRVDMFASATVREVDDKGNVVMDVDTVSVIAGSVHRADDRRKR